MRTAKRNKTKEQLLVFLFDSIGNYSQNDASHGMSNHNNAIVPIFFERELVEIAIDLFNCEISHGGNAVTHVVLIRFQDEVFCFFVSFFVAVCEHQQVIRGTLVAMS